LKKKTHGEFLLELQSRQPELFSTLDFISEYTTWKKPIQVICRSCGHGSSKFPSNLMKGMRCQKCYKVDGDEAARHTHEYFMSRLASETNTLSHFELLESYVSAKHRISVKCLSCGSISSKSPTSLLTGKGCKACAISKQRLTEQEILNGLNKHFSGYSLITPVEAISSNKQKIEYECNIGHKCEGTLNSLLSGSGCRECAYVKLNHQTLLEETVSSMPHIRLVGGQYKNSRSVMLLECEFHGVFKKRADAILYEGKGCPACASANIKYYSSKLAERNKSDFLNREAYLYVLSIEGFGTKVGISVNPASRIKRIMRQSGSSVISHLEKKTNLYEAILLEDMCLNNFNRKQVMKSFDGYTELLDCSPEDLIAFINKA